MEQRTEKTSERKPVGPRVQTRADEAVRAALLESRKQLAAFLQRRLGDPVDAEDVLQTFILRALERSGQLREIGSLRGWLGRILATTIADHERRSGRRRKREPPIDPSALERLPAETGAEMEEAVCNCLYRLLPTLKKDYAELIWRIDLAGEPRSAPAAATNVSPGTFAVRLHRARQALKRRLLEMCLTCPEHGFLDCGCETAGAAKAMARLGKPATKV